MSNTMQGVLSKIDFPLGQDEYAVSRAIHQLLSEGWEFVGVTKTELTLMRKWEVDLSNDGMVAKDERVKEKIGEVPKFHCVYCNKPMKHEGTCPSCGRKEDVALGKIEEI